MTFYSKILRCGLRRWIVHQTLQQPHIVAVQTFLCRISKRKTIVYTIALRRNQISSLMSDFALQIIFFDAPVDGRTKGGHGVTLRRGIRSYGHPFQYPAIPGHGWPGKEHLSHGWQMCSGCVPPPQPPKGCP